MLVIRVELHSAITGKVTEIARAEIANVGGTDTHGNYHCRSLFGRGREALDRRREQRHTTIEGYPRKALHVWNLVASALSRMGYGWG